MNAVPSSLHPSRITTDSRGVIQCYDTLSLAEKVGGISDFTDGIYYKGYGDDEAGYTAAQKAKARSLLNRVGCEAGSHILDIGCGYGRILEEVRDRGAKGLGITLSEPQASRCREKGLDVRVMNYRDVPQGWAHAFNGIIANGSAEHFVQPEDAQRGVQDELYREFFEICWRLLELDGYLATTVIHFRDPEDANPIRIMSMPHPRGSRGYQFNSLFSNLHGWYPIPGQLERASERHFKLIAVTDGTEDYRRTSEFWLRQIKRKFTRNPSAITILLKSWLRRDATWRMIRCWAFDQSWAWQFRPGLHGEPPPTVLYRHWWKRMP